MYRIKLASGNETTYNSIDALTAAVQDGEVDAAALIYHQRADRWLSVTNHPHYVIALSRIQTPAQPAEASRRQVVSAVRPAASQPSTTRANARSEPDVPPTVARSQIFEVVAEMEKGQEQAKTAKRLSIPSIKKPDTASPIRAHENVLNGVVVTKPTPTNGTGNGTGHSAPANGNGNHSKPQQTTALPVRTASPPAPRANGGTKVPDLGDGLDLVDAEAQHTVGSNGSSNGVRSPSPKVQTPSETPEIDRLLSLLESTGADQPTTPKPAAAKAPVLREPARKAEPVLDAPSISLEAPLFDVHAMAEPAPVVRRQTNRKPAMIGAGAAIIFVVGLLIWRPWSGKRIDAPTNVASTQAPRTEAFGGLSSVENSTTQSATPSGTAAANSATSDSAARSAKAPVDSAPSIIRVVAPRVDMNIPLPSGQLMNVAEADGIHANISASTLAQHYNEAYADARSELELRMLQIGFTQVFLRSRLTTTSGLQDTRRLIGSAASALRQYRGQESRIEKAYQDTVGTGGRALNWTARDLGTWNTKPSQRESPETLRLTNLLLSQMDSVFSLLQDQDGKYQISGETISFSDGDAARQYGALRAWLNQQADSYGGSGETALPGTLRQAIKSIGNTRLPQERRN